MLAWNWGWSASFFVFFQKTRAVVVVVLALVLLGCGEQEETRRVGIVLGSSSVGYPVVAAVVQSPSPEASSLSPVSELFLLNLEDGKVRRRRPAQLNPNSITGVASDKGTFLLTAFDTLGSRSAIIRYDFFSDREYIVWESGNPVRWPFQLSGRICALQPSAFAPKGQAIALYPVCSGRSYPEATVPLASQLLLTGSKAIIVQDLGKNSSVVELTAVGQEFQVRETKIPIETFAYGFRYEDRVYISGSNVDKRLFELTEKGLSGDAAEIADRLARSFRGKTERVLYMDDAVTVLVSANYSNASVTFSVVDAAGNKVRQHILDLAAE